MIPYRDKKISLFTISLILILVMFTTACSTIPVSSQDPLPALTNHWDERIPQWMDRYAIPGAVVAMVHNNELVWMNAYGVADLETQRRMTVDTICRVESISKPVTAFGIMNLVQQGLLDLDVPISRYLDDFSIPISEFDLHEVTLRQLLSHTAGIRLGTIGEAVEYTPGEKMPSLTDFLADEVRIFQSPGSAFMYSDAGYNLLELIVEKVTGLSFSEYMAAEILSPLGMHRSSYAWNTEIQNSIPKGYDLRGDVVEPYIYPAGASGGLFANIADISRFVMAEMEAYTNEGQPVISAEHVQDLHIPQVEIPGMFGFVADAYGLGHFIEYLPNGQNAFWHGGQGHGWMTHFHAIPDTGDAIIILTNSQRSWPFMANLLRDWSSWVGLAPVKFSRIIYASWAFNALVILTTILAGYLLATLGMGLLNGTRIFSPFSTTALTGRIVQFIFGAGGVVALLWAIAQPYLFVSSIFPGSANWAAFAAFSLSFTLILNSIFVRK